MSGGPLTYNVEMATITLSDAAPQDTSVHFVLPDAEFDLGGRDKKYESDVPAVLAEANNHGWLTVTVAPETPAVNEQQTLPVDNVVPATPEPKENN